MKEESGCVVAFIKPRRIGHEGNGLVRAHSEPHITSAVDGVEWGPKKYNRFFPRWIGSGHHNFANVTSAFTVPRRPHRYPHGGAPALTEKAIHPLGAMYK